MALVVGGRQGCKHGGVPGQLCQQLSSGCCHRTPARYCPSVRGAPSCFCLLSLAQIQGSSGLLLLPSPTSLGKEQGEAGLGVRFRRHGHSWEVPGELRIGFMKVGHL